MAKKDKRYFITIPADSNEENAKNEQFKVYQKDGQTIQVPIGRSVEVPEWLALLAKHVGDIADFTVVE